jgi:RNA polymerase sigma-70 factor, ECF subfamily
MDARRLVAETEEKAPALSPVPAAGARTDTLKFEDVYAAHFGFVWRSLRLLGVSSESLPDVAQEVFGVVYRRLGEFEGRSALATWIFAIARRVAANHHRKQRHLASVEPLSGSEPSRDPTPLALMEAARAAEALVVFSETLDEERRALFVLALIEEVPVPELVEPLGLPLNTLYSRIRALRKALEDFLERGEHRP